MTSRETHICRWVAIGGISLGLVFTGIGVVASLLGFDAPGNALIALPFYCVGCGGLCRWLGFRSSFGFLGLLHYFGPALILAAWLVRVFYPEFPSRRRRLVVWCGALFTAAGVVGAIATVIYVWVMPLYFEGYLIYKVHPPEGSLLRVDRDQCVRNLRAAAVEYGAKSGREFDPESFDRAVETLYEEQDPVEPGRWYIGIETTDPAASSAFLQGAWERLPEDPDDRHPQVRLLGQHRFISEGVAETLLFPTGPDVKGELVRGFTFVSPPFSLGILFLLLTVGRAGRPVAVGDGGDGGGGEPRATEVATPLRRSDDPW